MLNDPINQNVLLLLGSTKIKSCTYSSHFLSFLQDHIKNVRKMITSDDVDRLLCLEPESDITMIVTEALP